MRIEIDGQRYDHFLGGWVEVSIQNLSRRFQFTAATRGVGDIPFRPGQSAVIWIDEDRLLTGWIERIDITADPGAEEITYTIAGRDKIADLVDSNIDGLSDFSSTIARAADAVLRFLGVDSRVVDLSDSASRPFSGAAELAKPDPSETAADFLWGVASRRQILLSSDGDGNLLLLNGDPEPIETRLTNRVDGEGNNLVGFRFASDHSKRFRTYHVVSQPNVAEMSFFEIDLDAPAVSSVSASFQDARIRRSRRRTIAGESSYSIADARSRARWDANLARASGLTYMAALARWRDDDGALWRVNTAPIVEDEFAGISSRMLITDVRFQLDETGPLATLILRRRDAYASQAALNEIELRARAAADALDDESLIDLEGLVLE